MALQKPGFRFYPTDIILFVLAGISAYGMSLCEFTHAFYMMPVYIIFSFFMFCNVLRIGTTLEAVFAIGVIITHTIMYVRTGDTFRMYIPMSFGIIAVALVSGFLGWYRGVCWRTVSMLSRRTPEEIEHMPASVLKVRDYVTYLLFHRRKPLASQGRGSK